VFEALWVHRYDQTTVINIVPPHKTKMSHPQHHHPERLRIHSAHVTRQFARRSPLDAAQFLYGEIAQRMLQRLSYIRVAPAALLDAGCGAAHAFAPLRAHFPAVHYTGLDACGTLLDVARQRHLAKPGLWQRVTGRPVHTDRCFIQADLADSTLPPESLDLVWSNLVLHWHPAPHRVLAEWRRILKPGALAMFSCLGPTSLQEIRQAMAQADLQTSALPLVDMHDFGDLLLQQGFSDPVMDQEILTLTYRSPQKLLQDLRVLGGNPSMDRRASLPGRQWHARLLSALEQQRCADGTLRLTLEIAYGHAWRSASRRHEGETRIAVSAIRRVSRRAQPLSSL